MTTEPTAQLSLMERLKRGDKLISDGGSGTYLQAHGLEPGGSPELMNIEQPDVVRQMAADFFAAGSDMVLTNSFGGNRIGLERYGFGDRVIEFNKAAAELARSAAPEGGYVGGSIGPTGVFMQPLGDVTEQEMYDVFKEQVTGLAAGGADAIVIETMISTAEARVAIKAAKENTDLPVMATMTFDKGPRGYFTMMGDTPEDAIKILSDAGADIVGTNCGNGADVMLDLVKRIRPITDKPILVHSNAGLPAIVNGVVQYPESPEYMAPRFKEMAELGASIIGGCCGTTPRHLAACAASIKDS
ncbi:MAG: homocysteine S-methyltransferase family protein [Chloroflexi bacterium]|nr:homocysteine S-methyltransferase family protein [Chloroflexota bacterium]